jgi:hypothetical protein
LHGEGVGEKLRGSGEYLGLVTLDVEFEEDVAVGEVAVGDVAG